VEIFLRQTNCSGLAEYVQEGSVLISKEVCSLPPFLTLRDEHRLRVSENRALRAKFGTKRDEMVGSWGKLNNEELHNLYSLPNIIKMINSTRMS
jgi:hypothetical protein